MEYAVQNAFERAKREHIRSNLSGTIGTLSEAFKVCSDESKKLIYFEMATYYQQYEHTVESFSMLLQALDHGYSREIIDKFILKHFIKEKKYEENYNHNKALLGKYAFFKGKPLRNFNALARYILYADGTHSIFVTFDKKIEYEICDEPDIQMLSDGTILFLDNCQNIVQIIFLNKVSEKINLRKSSFYIFFERTNDLEGILTYIKLDNLLIDNQIIFLVGLEETESFFSDLQSMLPTHIYKNEIEPINDESTHKIILTISNSRKERIERSLSIIKQNYTGNQDFIYSEIKNSNIKLLFLSTRFDAHASDIAMRYYVACSKLGYKYQQISEKSEMSSSRDMEYVMIERFIPNIVFTVNSFRHQRQNYPNELIFLTYLDNINNIDLADLLSVLTKNDFIFAGTVIYHKLFKAEFPVRNIIELPLIVNPNFVDSNPLRNLMYKCDVCIIADYADTGAILSKIQAMFIEVYPDKENDIFNALNIIKSKYLSLFFAEKFVLGRKETNEMVSEAFLQNGIELDEDRLYNITEEFRTNYSRSLYNTTIANWLLRSGITNIKLWGKEWHSIPSFRDFSLGPILNEDILKKVLSNTKIVIGSDLFEANIIEIYNAFESGAMYLQNTLYTKDQLIALELGGKSENGMQYFSSKQDFLNKVSYFRENEQVRTEIVKKGRAFFTMDIVCKKVLPRLIESVANIIL